MTDSEFLDAADATLARIGRALDAASDASDADIDWSNNDGVLTIDCGDGSKLIVNRHLANREIWLAARSGGFHFRMQGGSWRDTRSGAELGAELARLVAEQAGLVMDAPALPAPA